MPRVVRLFTLVALIVGMVPIAAIADTTTTTNTAPSSTTSSTTTSSTTSTSSTTTTLPATTTPTTTIPTTTTTTLPPKPTGPVDIVILGGTAVVSKSVANHLESCTAGTVTRIAGSNRYDTAARISRQAFPHGSTRAYITVGTNFPDGVAAGAAAALNGAPLLLTGSWGLSPETAAELRRLGVSDVFLLGGPAVISTRVESQLSASYTVTRLQGANRYATAAAVSASAFPGTADTVFIATGRNFPDALVGGPAAFSANSPILLTSPTQLPPETARELSRLQPEKIMILGGASVVSSSVETSLKTYAPVTRLAGRDRYATAASISKTLPKVTGTVYLTTGSNFPDALAATSLARWNPLLLVSRWEVADATAKAISSFTGEPCDPLYFRKVSEYTTYYRYRSSTRNRVSNIHTIAGATNGAVVMPGQTFSLNAYVGKRTTAKGYKAAPAIINGEVYCCDSPINIGGGTSQFATTLYNAIFFGGYEIVKHKPHSIWFSHYPQGREATLGYPRPDVQFRNDTSTPVVIRTRYTNTSVTVEFWGWNDGRSVTAGVSGYATTQDGGHVAVTREVRYPDGTVRREHWGWTYHPLHPDRR